MKVLVTGAAGFLGGHLVDMLLECGDEVRALVRPVEDVERLRKLKTVEIVHGDLTEPETLKQAVQGIECIYNVAAKTGPWGPEQLYWDVNVRGVVDLVEAAMEAGVRRIVHTSSITVYGHHLRGLVTENYPFHAEDNPYSRTKIASERLLYNLVRDRGAPIVIVRPGWIYGPRDTASFARFVEMVEAGKGFLIGSGHNIVPLVYVRDVALGLILAGEAGDEVIGEAYTITDDLRISQSEYLNAIADFLDVPPVTRHIPYCPVYAAGRGAELLWTSLGRRNAAPPPVSTYGITLLAGNQLFSIDKARRQLGYIPAYDLMRGLDEGITWYQARKNVTSDASQKLLVAAKN